MLLAFSDVNKAKRNTKKLLFDKINVNGKRAKNFMARLGIQPVTSGALSKILTQVFHNMNAEDTFFFIWCLISACWFTIVTNCALSCYLNFTIMVWCGIRFWQNAAIIWQQTQVKGWWVYGTALFFLPDSYSKTWHNFEKGAQHKYHWLANNLGGEGGLGARIGGTTYNSKQLYYFQSNRLRVSNLKFN